MADDSRPARPWLQELVAIQRQMSGVSEAEVLAALDADEIDETVGATTAIWSGLNRPETTSFAATVQRTVHVRTAEQPLRSESASTPTS